MTGAGSIIPPDVLVVSIPLMFQVFFAALIFVNGYAKTVPGLAVMAIAMGIVGLLAFLTPSWYHIRGFLVPLLTPQRGNGNA